jgi:hypothetical protein
LAATSTQDNGTVRVTPPDSPPPFPQLVSPNRVQLKREYAAGGESGWFGGGGARSLPHAIDDVSADFGDDIYNRMLLDGQISACVTVYKASILETGPVITPIISDKDDPAFELSKEICDQAIQMFADMETSFNDVLWNLLDSCAFGNKVAEKVYGEAASLKDGKEILTIRKLKVKSRRNTVFAVDSYMNLVGLLVAIAPNTEPVSGTTVFVDNKTNRGYGLVSKEKFIISTFRPEDSDPRGTSIIRPAYTPWWRKQQVIPEYLKYLAQFAGPSLVGIAAPDTQDVIDPDNPDQTVSATQAMLAALEQFRNMTAIAVANGADVKPISMQGDGAAFRMAIAEAHDEITKAILTQQLATDEGRHMARAAATVHQDVLDTLVRQGKLNEQDMIRNQILKPWVVLNWGEKAARLAPIADLGATEQRDKPGLWQGAAALMNSKYFTEDQLQAMDAMLGVPIRQQITSLAFQLQKKGVKGPDQQPAPTDPNKIVVRPHERNRPKRTEPNDQPADQPNNQPKEGSFDDGFQSDLAA